jgi:hypothetical protein
MVPIFATYGGPFRGVSSVSLKNGQSAPSWETVHLRSRARVFLSSGNKERMICMGRTYTANRGNNLKNDDNSWEYSREVQIPLSIAMNVCHAGGI